MALTRLNNRSVSAVTSFMDAGAATGTVLQVVEGYINNQPSTTTYTSFVDTGLTATITPSSTSSKILVMFNGHAFDNTNGHNNHLALYRDSTPIGKSGSEASWTIAHSGLDGRDGSFSVSVLDTPSTTSSITYSIKFRAENGTDTAHFNSVNQSTATIPRSTIHLMEIAG